MLKICGLIYSSNNEKGTKDQVIKNMCPRIITIMISAGPKEWENDKIL